MLYPILSLHFFPNKKTSKEKHLTLRISCSLSRSPSTRRGLRTQTSTAANPQEVCIVTTEKNPGNLKIKSPSSMANTNFQKVDFPFASSVFLFFEGVNRFPHVISCNYVGRDVEDVEGLFLFECLGLQ